MTLRYYKKKRCQYLKMPYKDARETIQDRTALVGLRNWRLESHQRKMGTLLWTTMIHNGEKWPLAPPEAGAAGSFCCPHDIAGGVAESKITT